MKLDVTLRYGRTSQTATVEGGRVVVIEPDDPAPLKGPAVSLALALARPDFGPPLASVAAGARRPVIVVSDITRKTGIRHLLPGILAAVRQAAAPGAAIRVLVAYGNHRAHTPAENAQLYGELPADVELVHHDSRDDSSLEPVGRLPAGRMLRIARIAAASDCLILTGAVSFHYTAGFGGGRKAILPGIASWADILANHALTLVGRETPGPRSWGPGILDGNPLFEEAEAARELVRPAFLINTVMAGDRIGRIFAGDPRPAHRAACALVSEHYVRRIDRPAELVAVSTGGHPRDLNFYQAHKPLDYAARACADGGALILLAECPDGWGGGGAESFVRHAKLPDFSCHLAALRESFEVPGQTALAYREKIQRIRVVLVSSIAADEVRALGMTPAADLAAALRAARDLLDGLPEEAIVIPRGGETLPQLAAAASV